MPLAAKEQPCQQNDRQAAPPVWNRESAPETRDEGDAAKRHVPSLHRGNRRCSAAGDHQFHLPSNRIVAGTSSARTRVASSRIAMAVPKPSALIRMMSAAMNEPETRTMIAAALVITPPLRCRPCATLAWLSPVSRY